MGRTQAQDMVNMVDPETALRWHLQSNHYPPVPESMVAPCQKAIALATEEKWDELIDLPEGVRYKQGEGGNKAPVRALIENYHLQDFLPTDEEG